MAQKKAPQKKASKKKEEDQRIRFRYQGKKYDVGIGDLNAVEIRDFRRETGIPFGHLTLRDFDLDVIATIIWLVDRRVQPRLTWEDVAEELNYHDIKDVDAQAKDDDEESEDSSEDPSESGGNS